MTQADDVDNIIIGTGGGAVTIYTELVEHIYAKIFTNISPPQSSANWASGPKSTKIVDLLRLTIKFTVRGSIESTDTSKVQTLLFAGGVFNMTWDGNNYNINVEKLVLTKGKSGEQNKRDIFFTCVVGVDV